METILAYLFYFVAASASPLQRRRLAKTKNKENNGQIRFAFQVSAIVALLSLVLPFFQPFQWKGNGWLTICLGVVCGVFWASYFICAYTAQKHVEAWVSSLVSNINTPIAIILATLFLHEGLTMIQIAGTCLLLVGMVVVSKKHKIGRFTFDKYFVLMTLSGVALGACITAERALMKITWFTAGTMISWWSQFLFLGLTARYTRQKRVYSPKDIAITGVLRFFQSLSWVVLIFVVGNLSIVSSITTFKIVIVFIAAAFLLGEREDMPRKILWSLIAVVGLLCMK